MTPQVRVPHPSLPSPWSPGVDLWSPTLRPWTDDPTPPLMWSVAGTDSGGGAGLAADTRAAAAMGVHLCTVVAAITAQNSMGVQGVFPVDPSALRAQLQALRADLPARVIKTGLLARASAVDVLLAQRGDALLVVDPVLGASAGGTAFCNDELLAAYRHQLLPQATLITPNRREAERLLGVAAGQFSVPELARRLRRLGPQAVCITGGDDVATGALASASASASASALLSASGPAPALALDWLDSPLATGWMALPRLHAAPGQPMHHHGSGCTFATAAAAALARGFPLPDAVILAKMLTWTALRDGHAAGTGAGPLRPGSGFVSEAAAMPLMSQADDEVLSDARLQQWSDALQRPASHDFRRGLYAITDQPSRVTALATSGVFEHVQLRIKRGPGGTASDDTLRASIRQALDSTSGSRCTVWINDHWRLALDAGATALHLGQEDWTSLTPDQRADLQERCRQGQLQLGLSSHSLWELCRARAVAPTYIACGPLWPTTTKDMPWQPQGMAQLAWWSAMAGRPVVAIGGILEERQVEAAWQAGASAVCLVRAAESWRARLGEQLSPVA
ncbi:bifunctional hydroxymethylpyrimidine kinase/phosphomethylpyrimidine kinase [Roseateles terrae]|uniref:hydroxymethylpyrimidine kinase n=1 Tax=Roseateles terrae TaxID=431060 RepID=A0ABR6GYR7_9BURK|nr:bifunctional hydroxymethylpyrimidine kinase/phosphomethylpyrimidine kinase [Roseateles terrae]MBB3197257.1 hydroxymethylpyrimidine kinase/phosphomethylpyrimidine kinase/thiamine-phosphate diphosphorylase [Roseateles terrae]OWQ83679.1 hypothetical protein CDN98_21795 [Roseateles terrae]